MICLNQDSRKKKQSSHLLEVLFLYQEYEEREPGLWLYLSVLS